jgi:tellurite resistance protein
LGGPTEAAGVTIRRLPPNFFAIAFGIAGLAGCWLARSATGATHDIGNILLALAGAVWLVSLVAYSLYAAANRGTVVGDLTDRVAGPFMSLVWIVPMLLAAEGLAPRAATAGKVVVDIGVVLTIGFGGWFTGEWIYGDIDVDRFHPGYFLPTVAGGLIGSASAAAVGQQRLAYVMLGLGLFCWVILGSIILGRLLLRPMLPDPLVPTLAIEVAPAPVAILAIFAEYGPVINGVTEAIAGYGLLMALAQLRLLPAYRRLPFMSSFWAFTFSWAAAARVGIVWLQVLRPRGCRVGMDLILIAITALVVCIALKTVVGLVRGTYLPTTASPTPDTSTEA